MDKIKFGELELAGTVLSTVARVGEMNVPAWRSVLRAL